MSANGSAQGKALGPISSVRCLYHANPSANDSVQCTQHINPAHRDYDLHSTARAHPSEHCLHKLIRYRCAVDTTEMHVHTGNNGFKCMYASPSHLLNEMLILHSIICSRQHPRRLQLQVHRGIHADSSAKAIDVPWWVSAIPLQATLEYFHGSHKAVSIHCLPQQYSIGMRSLHWIFLCTSG